MVERRELYNRLMCRDAADYRALTGQAPKSRNPIRANLQRQFDEANQGEQRIERR
jgi:hypothetical protein